MKPKKIKEWIKDNTEGIVLMPYVIKEHTEESLNSYKEFMSEYKKTHEVCPKCGSKSCMSTLMGYILDSSNKENYKDLNRCTCMDCGDVHTCHERISMEEFNSKK